MSCIVTPMPPAPHAPCMRALAPSYDSPLDSCCALSVKVWTMPFHWQNYSSEYDLN